MQQLKGFVNGCGFQSVTGISLVSCPPHCAGRWQTGHLSQCQPWPVTMVVLLVLTSSWGLLRVSVSIAALSPPWCLSTCRSSCQSFLMTVSGVWQSWQLIVHKSEFFLCGLSSPPRVLCAAGFFPSVLEGRNLSLWSI